MYICVYVTHVGLGEGVCAADKVVPLLLAPGSVICREEKRIYGQERSGFTQIVMACNIFK